MTNKNLLRIVFRLLLGTSLLLHPLKAEPPEPTHDFTGHYVGSFEVHSSSVTGDWDSKNYRKCGSCHVLGTVDRQEGRDVLTLDITHDNPARRDRITLKDGKEVGGRLVFENASWSIAIDKDKKLTGTHSGRMSGKIELAEGEWSLPKITIPQLPANITMEEMVGWTMPGPALQMNQPKQITFARTETADEELSGTVKVGYNERGIYFMVAVHDKKFRPSEKWPSGAGSSVSLCFDLRAPSEGLGDGAPTKSVHKLLFSLLPQPFSGTDAVATETQMRFESPFKSGEVLARRVSDTDYWIAYRIPWEDFGKEIKAGQPFGFDVGINGGCRDKDRRTHSMALFGISNNWPGAYARATIQQ